MLRFGLRCIVMIVACVVVGCGNSGGLEPGIPKDTSPPVNPTPDMDPNPAGKAVKAP